MHTELKIGIGMTLGATVSRLKWALITLESIVEVSGKQYVWRELISWSWEKITSNQDISMIL